MSGTGSMSPGTSRRLAAAGLDPGAVGAILAAALAEDLDGGIDVTTVATVPADQRGRVAFAARAAGCLAGIDIACATVEMVCGPDSTDIERLAADGDRLAPGDVIARVTAPVRGLLTAERTALNLLCHLSGVATLTRQWVDAVAGTGAVVRDTRKTTPLLRRLEKYAVRCGGGANHRMSLSDAALVKDNHIASAGGVAEAFSRVRALAAGVPVEIEVDTIDQLRAAIVAGADLVLCDNMPPAVLREAVAVADAHCAETGRAVLLEASGGLTLGNAAEVAATGVHFISVGALTHSAPVLDIGLDHEGTVGG